MTDERTIDAAAVRREHEQQVRRTVQWVYLAGVLVGGLLIMVALIAALGANA